MDAKGIAQSAKITLQLVIDQPKLVTEYAPIAMMMRELASLSGGLVARRWKPLRS